jgi:hypothetical protein
VVKVMKGHSRQRLASTQGMPAQRVFRSIQSIRLRMTVAPAA